MELVRGCRNKREIEKLRRLIAPFAVVWLSESACDLALDFFSRHGIDAGIGILDVLIAYTALALGWPLHTFNRKRYEVVPDLQIVQAYKKNVSIFDK